MDSEFQMLYSQINQLFFKAIYFLFLSQSPGVFLSIDMSTFQAGSHNDSMRIFAEGTVKHTCKIGVYY